ncbi:MAG TPA: FMN-binding protein [Marmoricola sp.]|jgi:uncharacterized protein with FMN-binding domain|nr:FMN-binding protein [Marmoricola sp.]
MRRIVMWAMSTLTALVLLFGYHTSTSGPAATSQVAQTPVGGSLPSTSSGSSPSTSSAPSTSSGSSSSSAGGSTTGTVTGPSVDTRWGPVQVEITTSAGKVTAVNVVRYPSGNGTDQQINSSALPVLVQETLQAQSAQIDMVSGATVTSDGYLQSLQGALDKAGL